MSLRKIRVVQCTRQGGRFLLSWFVLFFGEIIQCWNYYPVRNTKLGPYPINDLGKKRHLLTSRKISMPAGLFLQKGARREIRKLPEFTKQMGGIVIFAFEGNFRPVFFRKLVL